MTTASPFPNLQNQQFMNLTTYRKTGVPVTTPVWFAQVDDKLYVYTQANSGKVKRVRNNGKVEVSPCTRSGKPLGPTQPALAHILPLEEGKRVDTLLTNKYGLLKRIISFVAKLRGSTPAYLEIRPA
ncbi:MAG: PPOX class F420-dependent oxidoreductase [Caldilineaceae bacterium]